VSGSPDLTQINYSTRGGNITQIDPGVFFFWFFVDVTGSGSKSFTVSQTTTPTYNHFFDDAAGSAVFTGGCTSLGGSFDTNLTTGVTTVTFNSPGTGTYIVGIKYSANTLVGAPAPSGNGTVHYTFTGPAGATDGVDLVRKQQH
jgi:hypothetical protein